MLYMVISSTYRRMTYILHAKTQQYVNMHGHEYKESNNNDNNNNEK